LEKAVPIADAFRAWLETQRVRVPDGSATAKAIDSSLGRWEALSLYLDDGDVPCDNNWVENQIRPAPGSARLALRAMPVATRVVGDLDLVARRAPR
jgi:hypothetical protein